MKFALKMMFLVSFLLTISSFKSTLVISKSENHIVCNDTITLDSTLITYKLYKEKVHASYYHDKFNGRKTASGELFDNTLYTAAHKSLKFGTKIRVTNTVNDSSVIVTINDRGPFVKGRELDLSKKAFMEIAKYKQRGYLIVNIEIMDE